LWKYRFKDLTRFSGRGRLNFFSEVCTLRPGFFICFSRDKDQSALSFNGDIEGCGNHPKVKLDIAAFIAKFPNCKAGSAPGGGDGRTGAFKNLQNNCDNWDTVAAIDGGIWTD
jgi:hypothetical protein